MSARDWFLLSWGLAACLGLLSNLSVIDRRDPMWVFSGWALLAVGLVSGALWFRRWRMASRH